MLKFGVTHSGHRSTAYCIPEDLANITVENVYVKDWVGPYVAVLEPVKNLTLRGLRGDHTGHFFHNYGQEIDGLTLEDCRVTLKGGPHEPFVGGMMLFCMAEWGLDPESRDGTPAAILLNNGPLKDVDIRNVVLRSGLMPGDIVTGSGVAGLWLGPNSQIQSLNVSDLKIDGFESGIIVEAPRGEDLRIADVTMRNVATPWLISGCDLVQGDLNISWH